MRSTFFLISSLVMGATGSARLADAQRSNVPSRVVDLRVGEYFILAPDSIPAGLVTLRLTQSGDATKPWPGDMEKLKTDLTYHFDMIWLVRLDSGKTVDDLLKAERDRLPTPWATILGGPAFADTPGSSNVTLVVPRGNYALACFVGSAREDRSRYHLLKGMVRALKVTDGSTSARLPEPQQTIVLRNDSTLMNDTLRAGSYRILVRNEGQKSSDFHISRLKRGYTVAQARAWRARSFTEPPKHAVGGIVWIPAKRELMTTIGLEPGDYLFGDKHVVVGR